MRGQVLSTVFFCDSSRRWVAESKARDNLLPEQYLQTLNPLEKSHTVRSTTPRFGVHLSVAGGLENACHAAVQIGCDCLQIFVKNQRQWNAPDLTPEQIERFRSARQDADLAPVVAHASYLLNLASPDRSQRRRSVRALADEYDRCEKLGVDCLVFHPGAHMDGTPAAGIKRIVSSLNEVVRRCDEGRCMILLETTAGQGTSIGFRFEQIGAILEGVKDSSRLGVCLDTCHLFAAGYDFRTAQGYATMMDELDRAIGVASVRCIHMNDSKREVGSRVDRHEHLGKGKIGKRGLARFVNDARWHLVPMILETPKGQDGRGTDLDKVNIKRLRALIED